jgi:hypothetical protein
MPAVLRGSRPRIAVDTNVLMDGASLNRLLLAADRRLVEPIWSARVVGELARAGLWRLGRRAPGGRSFTTQQYEDYRDLLCQRIDEIDLRFELVRSAPTGALDDEVAWSEAGDRDDLHLQILARSGQADCVVSWNHHDFPSRQVVDGRPCGELCGIIWITPDQLPSLHLPVTEVGT